MPPKTKGDLAFVQHMVATTNANGMVGVGMPHGVLFRGAAEGEIRRALLQEDLEAVVGLPTNLFYGTGLFLHGAARRAQLRALDAVR